MPTTFDTADLRPELLDALDQVGFTEMTPIQARALPLMLAGIDVTGQAKTGSGKTAAFGLALLNDLDADLPVTQALVLCPTRELAEQVAAELRRLAQRLPNMRILTVCGGQPGRDQTQALAGGSQVVVGTPGRVGDHLRKRSLDLSRLSVLVLDEADRMLEMGFIDQVRAIVRACPRDRQTLLFSATFPDEIARLRDQVQRTPEFVSVESRVAPEQLRQLLFECRPGDRQQTVADLLATYRPQSTLVFCETRGDCDALAAFLTRLGAVALALHGEMEQRDRTEVLLQFAHGSASVLVATNVAARGLDIPALPAVIVFELSRDAESHLHRIGRTGRAGELGLALSIVASPAEQKRLERVEAFMGQRIVRGPRLKTGGKLDFLKPPNRTLMLLAGRKDKLRKADVLGALVKEGGIPSEAIGRIDLMDKTCAVAIAREHARTALKFARAARIKKVRVRGLLLGD